jgi:hypothetical protein
MSALSGLIGKFFSESTLLRFVSIAKGTIWSVQASTLVDMAAAGAMGINPEATEPLHLDNTGTRRESLRARPRP